MYNERENWSILEALSAWLRMLKRNHDPWVKSSKKKYALHLCNIEVARKLKIHFCKAQMWESPRESGILAACRVLPPWEQVWRKGGDFFWVESLPFCVQPGRDVLANNPNSSFPTCHQGNELLPKEVCLQQLYCMYLDTIISSYSNFSHPTILGSRDEISELLIA